MKPQIVSLTCILVLLPLCASDGGYHEGGNAGRIMKECMQEKGLDKDQMHELQGKARSGDADAAREIGCLKACTMEKFGTMEGTEIKLDKAIENVNRMFADDESKKTQAIEKLEACKSEVQGLTDKCEIAGKVARCMRSIWRH